MNKKTGIFVFLIMVSAILFNVFSLGSLIEIVQAADVPTKEWEMSYGTLTEDETANSVVQTSDGGYIIAGERFGYPGPPTGYDAILVKVDSDGNIEWDKIIGNDQYFDAEVTSCAVVQTSGGYVLAGTMGGAAERSFWLYKAHLDGSLNWYTVFSGPYDDQYDNEDDKCHSMIQTTDGGFVLGGQAGYRISGPSAWLMKSSSSGSKIWSQTYNDIHAIHSVVETSDGGLAFGGPGGIWPAGYLVKTDSAGNQQWIRSVHFVVDSVVQTSDGGYALAGEGTGQERGDWFLVKTDSSGLSQWNRTHYNPCYDLTSMIQTSDGEYVMVGSGPGHHPMEPQPEEDWLMIKTDSNGMWEMSSNEWPFLFGSGITDDKAHCVIETSDGGLAVAGFLYKNAGLIKLSPLRPQLTLNPGWNMVSFPVLPDDASFSSIFDDVKFYQVLTWDGTSYITPTNVELFNYFN